MQDRDGRCDLDLLVVDADGPRPLLQSPPSCPLRLIANQQDQIARVRRVVLDVVEDPSSRHHAAGGDDHRGPAHAVQGHALLLGVDQVERPLRAPAPKLFFGKAVLPTVLLVNLRGLERHGAVEVDRHTRQLAARHQQLQEVNDLLGPSDGEGGDQENPSATQHLASEDLELRIHVFIAVAPVSISRLQDEIIGFRRGDGVGIDRHPVASNVSREQDSHAPAPVLDSELDHGRAEKVPHIEHPEGNAGVELLPGIVLFRAEELHRRLHVVGNVERQGRRMLRLPLAVQELGILHLQVGGVQQHEPGQFRRGRGRVDRAAVTLADETGQVAAVVDMGMREKHPVHAARLEGCGLPVLLSERFEPLEHPAVDHQPPPIHLEQVARSSHRSRRAME